MFTTTVGRLAGDAPVSLHTVCEQAESSLSCITVTPADFMSQELLLETQAGYFYELLDDAYILHLCMSDAIPELPKHLSDSHCLNAT
jgi:hypothetical protein